MPWKECHVMDERLRFVARLLEGEKMAPLCAEFGISRKTGYKIFDRYKYTLMSPAADTHQSRRTATGEPPQRRRQWAQMNRLRATSLQSRPRERSHERLGQSSQRASDLDGHVSGRLSMPAGTCPIRPDPLHRFSKVSARALTASSCPD
jgi:hypothetical protein